ncbi:hypothetical protein TNCV_179471 [Trichonephila clavipes]|nr:hypothetical protein TNCV_179471 [Trichonephila clavipes]
MLVQKSRFLKSDKIQPSNSCFGEVIGKCHGLLLKSMIWCITRRLESEQLQRTEVDAVGVIRSVIARLWNWFQETGHVFVVGQNKVVYVLPHSRYVLLTARRNRRMNVTQIQKQFFFGNKTKVLKPNKPK